jgi:TPR repeat protein
MDSIAPDPNVLLALGRLESGDHDTAFAMFKAHAERGDLLAQHTVAWCYQQGVGCEVDPARAFEWWKRAALKGFAESQYAVGYCYEQGKVVEKDLLAAVSWYGLAADQHYRDASQALERIRHHLSGEQRSAIDA